MKSKNTVIDKETREELGNLSVIFWQDQYFVENTEAETSFWEENKYRDHYEGFTHLQFPSYWPISNIIHFTYYMLTSKTSGSVKTPLYGEPFDDNKFEYAAYYRYYIYFPPNIVNITELYPGLTIVLQFYADVSLYEGTEGIFIESMGYTGEQEWDGYALDYVDTAVYKREEIYNSGNVSIIRKYETSKFKDWEYISIYLDRVLEKTNVDKSLEKRNTGFQLTWHYEDRSGNKIDIETDQKYKEEIGNKRFVTFINLF